MEVIFTRNGQTRVYLRKGNVPCSWYVSCSLIKTHLKLQYIKISKGIHIQITPAIT